MRLPAFEYAGLSPYTWPAAMTDSTVASAKPNQAARRAVVGVAAGDTVPIMTRVFGGEDGRPDPQ